MRSKFYAVFILVLVLIITVGVFYWWSAPRLVEIYPQIDDRAIPAGTPLRLTFSRPVAPETLESQLTTDPSLPGQFTYEGNTATFVPNQAWPSSQTVTVRLAPGVRALGWLSIPQLQEQTWSFTVSHPLLAYLYPADAPADLYTVDPQTGEIRQITNRPGAVLDYTVHPSSNTIFFNTSQGDGGTTIYQLDLLKEESQVILRCPEALCGSLQISPDGKYLAYERTPLSSASPVNTSQVWLLPIPEIDTAILEQAPTPIPVADPDHRTQQPLWSSTGLLAYYDYDRSAFVIEDPNMVEVAQFPSQTGIPGAWHPSGERYVFPEIFSNEIADPKLLPELGAIPSSRLLQYHLDGTYDDLTGADDVEDASPAYAPNGTKLAFGRKFLDITRWTPGRQLWLMQLDSGKARALTNAPRYNHYDFSWSPDGSQLAYSRFNKDVLTDPPEIWLMNADGTEEMLLITGGYAPQWIP